MRAGDVMEQHNQTPIVDIEHARKTILGKALPGATRTTAKRKSFNRHMAQHAVDQFCGLGKNVYQAARDTGVPVAVLQEELRRIIHPEWARLKGLAA